MVLPLLDFDIVFPIQPPSFVGKWFCFLLQKGEHDVATSNSAR
jgi:hypothetical protein